MAGGGGGGMSTPHPHWLDHQRKRWMRPDAERWQQPNRRLWNCPDAPDRKFDPNQPRVPAGHPDGGQWTDGGESSRAGANENVGAASELVERISAQIIWICVAGSKSLTKDYLGNKTYWVTYDCADGRSFTHRGIGHKFPGFLLDRFR